MSLSRSLKGQLRQKLVLLRNSSAIGLDQMITNAELIKATCIMLYCNIYKMSNFLIFLSYHAYMQTQIHTQTYRRTIPFETLSVCRYLYCTRLHVNQFLRDFWGKLLIRFAPKSLLSSLYCIYDELDDQISLLGSDLTPGGLIRVKQQSKK